MFHDRRLVCGETNSRLNSRPVSEWKGFRYIDPSKSDQNLVDETYWQLNAVLEVNGSYLVNNSLLVFVSPGIQLALESFIVEASLQVPMIRALKSGEEPDFLFAVGTRVTW